MWSAWDETLVWGEAELKNILLAHGIILAIASVRYGAPYLRMWLRGRALRDDDGGGS
jgi:hypothetical protein